MKENKGFKFLIYTIVFLLVFTASGFAGGAQEGSSKGAVKQLVLGSGSPGGSYYPVGIALGNYLSSEIPEINVSVEATGGSVENIHRIEKGEIDIALAQASDLYAAQKGRMPYEGYEFKNVRQLANFYTAIVHLVVEANSGIERVADLSGERIGIGSPGSGSALAFEIFLKEIGIHSDVKFDRLSPSQGVQSMNDGHLKSFTFAGIPPTGFVQEAQATSKIKLVDMGPEGHESGFFERHPYYTDAKIEKGMYDGQTETVSGIGTPHCLAVGGNLSEELVYKITNAIFSEKGLKVLESAVNNLKIDKSKAGGVGYMPWHEGAAKYWVEQGQQ